MALALALALAAKRNEAAVTCVIRVPIHAFCGLADFFGKLLRDKDGGISLGFVFRLKCCLEMCIGRQGARYECRIRWHGSASGRGKHADWAWRDGSRISHHSCIHRIAIPLQAYEHARDINDLSMLDLRNAESHGSCSRFHGCLCQEIAAT